MSKKISVIIPIYNGEKYISRCLESVLNQVGFDIKDLEILLLNDGSSDDSLAVLARYQKKYPAIIHVIDQKNIGVAQTRNKGIDLSKGTYIIFIDQDDWIDPDYCEVLYREIETGRFDAVYSGMKRPNESGDIVNKDVYQHAEVDSYFARFMCMSVWAKIHRTSFLQESKIQLFDNSYGEDIVFVFEEAQKTEKIKCIEYCGYNWFYNTESVSNTTQRGLSKNNITSLIKLQNKIASVDNRKDNSNKFFATMITAYYIFLAGKHSTPKQFLRGAKTLTDNLEKTHPGWSKNPSILKAPTGVLPLFSIGVKAFTILHKTHLLPIFAAAYCRGRD